MDKELSSEEILQLINQQKIADQREVALSVQAITEDERNWIRQVLSAGDSNPELTEDELNRLKKISEDYGYDYGGLIKLPPHYVRLKK
ncbi:hypothetical protein, partial [Peribacillus frigoritolerans]|uniref:hypothetical protein n=1 Tax=Peribacillus frigoritolerans TaxID=450367 RepID=UPI002280B290